MITAKTTNKQNRRKTRMRKFVVDHFDRFIAFGIALVGGQIPFIQNYEHAFAAFFEQSAKLLVLGTNGHRTIKHKQNNVGFFNRV